MIEVPPSYFADSANQERLLVEAESWLGTPFRHGAKVKGAGVDCVLFVAELMLACGVIDGYVFPAYTLEWAKHRTQSLVLEWLEASPRVALVPEGEPPMIGDVGCYKYGKCVHHCTVVLTPPTLVHAISGLGVDLGRIDDSSLSERFHCYYRPLPR